MIDVHCHLEQEDYKDDLDKVIERAKQNGLKAIVSCSADVKTFERGLEIQNLYKNYVFLTVSIHPIHVEEIDEKIVKEFFANVKNNMENIVGIGETGLDYYWVKDEELREKQKWLFREHIKFALENNLPIVIHSRESDDDTVTIIEEFRPKRLLWHFFGNKKLVDWIIENNYKTSFNTLLLRSKNHKKIVKKLPLENIMLETDAPWLGFGKRNEPSAIVDVAKKIAEIKKLEFEEVWNICGKNAIEFYRLPINI